MLPAAAEEAHSLRDGRGVTAPSSHTWDLCLSEWEGRQKDKQERSCVCHFVYWHKELNLC